MDNNQKYMVTIIFRETLDSTQKKKQWKPTLQSRKNDQF